jgi:hypothetical protein
MIGLVVTIFLHLLLFRCCCVIGQAIATMFVACYVSCLLCLSDVVACQCHVVDDDDGDNVGALKGHIICAK